MLGQSVLEWLMFMTSFKGKQSQSLRLTRERPKTVSKKKSMEKIQLQIVSVFIFPTSLLYRTDPWVTREESQTWKIKPKFSTQVGSVRQFGGFFAHSYLVRSVWRIFCTPTPRAQSRSASWSLSLDIDTNCLISITHSKLKESELHCLSYRTDKVASQN